MNGKRLCESVLLDIEYADTTLFGSMVSGRFERELKARIAPIFTALAERQWRDVKPAALRTQLYAPEVLGAYHTHETALHPACLYPPATQVTPRALRIENRAGRIWHFDLSPSDAASLAVWIGAWHRGRMPPGLSSTGRELYRLLDEAGLMIDEPMPAPLPRQDILFYGHASVRVGDGRNFVLTDPFQVPALADDETGYKPLSLHQGPIDGVLITHSHPDHFHLGTLLRLGADMPVWVPHVARESLLSIDMAARLRELGFKAVRTLAWGDCAALGELRIRAWPFHGEQPGVGSVLHPAVRNIGNAYTVETATRRYGFIADGGRDATGDMREVARAARAACGPVDVLFSGYRSWALYPAQLLGSSVGRYALLVPAAEWARRQVLMNGPDEALDVAEAWGARHLVPYADGGAPWFWARGLGPDLSRPEGHNPHFDPPPEVVATAAARRSSWGEAAVASPVAVTVLRPGQAASLTSTHGLRVHEYEGHRWPWQSAPSDSAVERERVSIARKKVLLRLLARTQMPVPPSEETQALADQLRRVAGLTQRKRMLDWLERVSLSSEEFQELIVDWARCNALEASWQEQIERLLPGQLALQSMTAFDNAPTQESVE